MVAAFTPGDLRAMRLRLGIQESQLATILGLVESTALVRKLEGGRQDRVWAGHAAELEAIEAVFLTKLAAILADAPPVLLTYPSEDELDRHEPQLALALEKVLGRNPASPPVG